MGEASLFGLPRPAGRELRVQLAQSRPALPTFKVALDPSELKNAGKRPDPWLRPVPGA